MSSSIDLAKAKAVYDLNIAVLQVSQPQQKKKKKNFSNDADEKLNNNNNNNKRSLLKGKRVSLI